MKTLLGNNNQVFEKRDGEYVPANYKVLSIDRDIRNDKAIVSTALYRIEPGATYATLAGEKKHYFKKNQYGNLQRYAVKNIIY